MDGLQVNNWMTCMGDKGLQVFTATADQRAALGEEDFLQTHFPMEMRLLQGGKLDGRLSEQQLLEKILDSQVMRPGNRVFVLYGAAGAGKSEMLKWLAMQISRRDPARAAATVRISRSELDVIRITEHFHSMLSGQYFQARTHTRWADLATKPLTLAKLLVLSALEQLLTHDDEINALFYWLTAPVQHNLEKSLKGLADAKREDVVLELFSQDDWDQLSSETELLKTVGLEELRQALVDAFRYHLLENVHLPNTLQLLSEDIVNRHHVRPVLLIDDLVRSLNLFAGDLMDYFMNLEAGSWDVIIGLTPASLQRHARGRHLLERITYLDTIDDRVQKLWLSDDFGHESYFLNEENCHEFAMRYLELFRHRNNAKCSHCPHQSRCRQLGTGADGTLLAPFNQVSLQRIFRKLPESKGKARYFIRAIESILFELNSGAKLPQALLPHIQLEYMARTSNRKVADLVEVYGTDNGANHRMIPSNLINLDTGVASFFQADLQPTYVAESTRSKPEVPKPHSSLGVPAIARTDDPTRAAIRRWLEGASTNRQLLKPVRQGLARWLRTTLVPNWLHRAGIARPKGILSWQHTYLDLPYPILLEDIDNPYYGIDTISAEMALAGIPVRRDIGMLAFDLARYSTASGDEANVLARQIAQDINIGSIIHSAHTFRNQLYTHLARKLSMPVEHCALYLYVFSLCLSAEPVTLPSFPPSFMNQVSQERARRTGWRLQLDTQTLPLITHLFDDFFRLRENIYDGHAIAQGLAQIDSEQWWEPIMLIDCAEIDLDYKLGQRSLAEVIGLVQKILQAWFRQSSKPELSPITHSTLLTLQEAGERGVSLDGLSDGVLLELQALDPQIYEKLNIYLAR